MTSWILRLLSITLATPHRLSACTDLISVFYFYPSNWSSHSTTINLFFRGWDLLPHSHHFPSSWTLALILSKFPGSICLGSAVHNIFTLSFPLTLLVSYPWNPSFPLISTLKKSHWTLLMSWFIFLLLQTNSRAQSALRVSTSSLLFWPPHD